MPHAVRLLLALVLFTPALPLAAREFSAERLERMHEALQAAVDRREYAGVNVMVAQGEETAFARSYGFRDLAAKAPMRDDTIFSIASMTKTVTAVAVMMLYEEGRFLLDEPISTYLPAFADVKVLVEEQGTSLEVVDAVRPITVRHLLTHTSGLAGRAFPGSLFDRNVSLRVMAEQVSQRPLAHQPGEAWRYGWSYDLLGALVEVWSGEAFDEFLQRRIFDPLGMVDTAFYVPAEKLPRLSRAYRLGEDGTIVEMDRPQPPSARPTYFSGGGGLYSTIGDYRRFAQMLAQGGELESHRLLSPLTVDYMMRNHVSLELLPTGPNGRKGFGMGLGGYVLVDPVASETLSVEGEYNGAGAGGTFFWIDRKNELVGLWFAQRYPQVPETLKRFKVLTYQALE